MSAATLAVDEVQTLVTSAQCGNGAAFATLYEHFSPKVYKYLYYHVQGRAELAEDLTAEVFFKVFERINRFQFRGLPFSSWVYRIAHNHLVDHIRAEKRTHNVALEDAENAPELRSEGGLELAISRDELQWALRRLTRERRDVVMARFIAGLSIQEAATSLGKSEVAVKKLQVRALEDLRRLMDVRSARARQASPAMALPA